MWPRRGPGYRGATRGHVIVCILTCRRRSAIFILVLCFRLFFFFQAEDGIRDSSVTGVQTCALPILTFVSQSQMGPDMFTLSHAANHVSDTIATLPSGHSDTITITVTINSNVPNGSQISNTAMVSSSTFDPNLSNNSSTSTLTINNSTGQGIQPNQTKPLSYWAGLLGQQLIKSFLLTSGGQTLRQWLATSFPNLFGGGNGADNLSGFSNSK